MTQEFDEWYKVAILPTHDISTPTKYTKEALEWTWQTSREQLKAKLLSDEMVEAAAEGMFPPLSILGDEDLEKARKYAKAALHAVVGGIMKTPEQKAYDKLWRDYDKAAHALIKMRDKLYPAGTHVYFAGYGAMVIEGSLYPHQINTSMGHMGWQYEGRKKL